MVDTAKYNEIFDYLSAPDLPSSAETAIVFGRNDPLVAYALGDLIIPSLVEIAIISGGVGKDTGDLLSKGYRSEAHFLEEQLKIDAGQRGYSIPEIILDEAATNGGSNARNSLGLLINGNIKTASLTAVAHATSSRRLAETLKFETEKKTGHQSNVHRKPTAYSFDSTNPADRNEAASELLRLADWPSKGFLGKQTDMPENLVSFVREVHGNAPKPVAPWQSAVLSRLPESVQLRVIQSAAKNGRK
jgi:hypothetical protein